MTPTACCREQDVLDALTGLGAVEGWPDDVRAHADACAICRDLVAVALPLLQDHQFAVGSAQPPSSAIVWWRAQMRARQEAAETATQPISVVQGAALAAGLGMFLILLTVATPTLSAWFGGLDTFSGLGELFALPPVELSWALPTTMTGVLLAGACAVCLLLAPLAVYFAFDDE